MDRAWIDQKIAETEAERRTLTGLLAQVQAEAQRLRDGLLRSEGALQVLSEVSASMSETPATPVEGQS